MKFINEFEYFLFERKHVNDDVIHYVRDILDIIENNNLSKDKINIKINLTKRDSLKISNIHFIVDINPKDFNNYGYFKKNNNTKFIDDTLDNCTFYLQLKLNDNEIKNNKISNNNKIYKLINHELHHALEIFIFEENNKKYRTSWEISKKYQKHRVYGDKFKIWSDFIYLIYLSLDHEMSSRVSEIYEEIINYKNPKDDIKNNKIYNDAIFMSNFNFDIFYNKFVNEYDENTFIQVCHQFFNDFDYKFIDDLNYCKSIIKKNIKSINKKGNKILRKINNVIDRVEQDKSGVVENEGYFEKNIDYSKYEKN